MKLKNLRNAKPREFWKIINSINNNKQTKNPLKDLYEHFKNINAEKIYEGEDETKINNTDGNSNNENMEINQHIRRKRNTCSS